MGTTTVRQSDLVSKKEGNDQDMVFKRDERIIINYPLQQVDEEREGNEMFSFADHRRSDELLMNHS